MRETSKEVVYVWASGRVDWLDRDPASLGEYARVGGKWFRLVGVARDRNTTFDGIKIHPAALTDEPANRGVAIYAEMFKGP